MEGRADLALMGYLKASELGYQRAQANAAWILSQNRGIPSGQSATSYVQPGDSFLLGALPKLNVLMSVNPMLDSFCRAICHWSAEVLQDSDNDHRYCSLQILC